MNVQIGEQNYLQILGREIRKLALPSDDATNLILSIYHPKCETTASDNDNNKIEKLSLMALKIIFKNYKKGAVHNYLQLGDKIWFGERLDIEKKLEDVIDLDVSFGT